ncbi:Uu.00g138800.m01.CDS01 [Anthostomella pinea]|uniref:Uu.00g138800.m01.CDS01 n=1 Tax=Anthostomella pinea TaxID=933095 RepID=A0AAI8YL91_9PEZI|nr:Uu.00g138800.m01.CDS01 [Anthostomella pinea]
MSADFWAGYISGAVGILIGNPLDVLKVRLQLEASSTPISTSAPSPNSSSSTSTIRHHFQSKSSLIAGTAAPVLGYGALNALLFVSYNRSEALLNAALDGQHGTGSNLWTTWLAGAIGGLATWVVSTPTELIKCRAQLAPDHGATIPTSVSTSTQVSTSTSSWRIARDVLRSEGIRGLYFGGAVTALRDSIGYGFYFWSYELGSRWMEGSAGNRQLADSGGEGGVGVADSVFAHEAAKVLLCGGLAGVVTWASIFPLDVVKTRVQTQTLSQTQMQTQILDEARRPLLGTAHKRRGAVEIAREAYREGGARVFFRGLTVCSVRAFIVNAVQWAVYEWIMLELGQGRRRDKEPI